MENGKTEVSGGQPLRSAQRDALDLPTAGDGFGPRPNPSNAVPPGRNLDPVPPGATPMAEEIISLRHQIAALHPPLRAEDVAAALRVDLNELRAEIRNAIPRAGGLATLEQQLLALAGEVAELVPRFAPRISRRRCDVISSELGATLHNAILPAMRWRRLRNR